jgi:probable F420-dependent oxidoreductase
VDRARAVREPAIATTTLERSVQVGAAPVVEDLSATIVTGRVTPAEARRGQVDAIEAERLGFRRIFLAERYNVKEAGAYLSGIAARTTRIEVGTGVLAMGSRSPLMTAALAATMHALYGPRFVLGLGRSDPALVKVKQPATYEALVDYATIVRRLLAGERVTYSGPAGDYADLALTDLPEDATPPIWYGMEGGPRASRVVANPVFDGVYLSDFMTVECVKRSIDWMRAECERLGRDPSTLRICLPIITACELDDQETLALTKARLVSYVSYPAIGALVERNGWDVRRLDQIRDHVQIRSLAGANVDHSFRRRDMLEPAKLVPDEWIRASCAVGTADECVRVLQSFKDVGVDEFATYGSSPVQNASLIAAWRAWAASSSTQP